MVTRVEWTDTAFNRYRDIIFYYKQHDAKQAALQFEKAVFSKIDRLKQYPTIGRQSKVFKTVRLINIDDKRQMSYRIKGKTLFICNFWDMRQDPQKRPF
jgi:plasmid stabilization system protein ParE